MINSIVHVKCINQSLILKQKRYNLKKIYSPNQTHLYHLIDLPILFGDVAQRVHRVRHVRTILAVHQKRFAKLQKHLAQLHLRAGRRCIAQLVQKAFVDLGQLLDAWKDGAQLVLDEQLL